MKPAHVAEAIRRAGGVDALPEIDGPRLDRWDPKTLAKALEHEVARAKQFGWLKISLHMDVEDAYRLALFLKKG